MTNDTRADAINGYSGTPTVPRPELLIGETDVSRWVTDFSFEHRIGPQNRAEFTLRKDVIDEVPLDYTGPVTLALHWNNKRHPQFFGLIELAFESQDGLQLLCRTSAELNDRSIVGLLHERVPYFEIIYTISRSAGYSDDQLDIHGMDTLALEEIEVIVPVQGIRVEEPVTIGDFELVPLSEISWAQDGWTEQGPARVGNAQQLVYLLARAGAFMRGIYPDRALFEAEQKGLRDAELVAAWLGTRLNFRAASLPFGKIQPYNRMSSGIRPTAGGVVAVRGRTSDRRWLRAAQMATPMRTTLIPVCDDWHDEPQLAKGLSLRDREALLAFWRSLDLADPLSSVIALWDAIEFYVGGTTLPGLFTEQDLRRLRDETPAWLSADQRKRFKDVLGGLNSPPLIPRLRAALDRDGVPITDAEFDLLRKLRRIRNPAQHGKERKAPSGEDLRQAWSIVARMLVYRSHTRAASGEQ
ncbi:hypothetical protein ACIG87_23060 [Micromonospora sp. NPDC051925]|uniref:hypothetical protein n=1 Tax=Micromonospora sp. NPDC051925 TaxID=3364288 RepID=UPI0037CC44F0